MPSEARGAPHRSDALVWSESGAASSESATGFKSPFALDSAASSTDRSRSASPPRLISGSWKAGRGGAASRGSQQREHLRRRLRALLPLSERKEPDMHMVREAQRGRRRPGQRVNLVAPCSAAPRSGFRFPDSPAMPVACPSSQTQAGPLRPRAERSRTCAGASAPACCTSKASARAVGRCGRSPPSWLAARPHPARRDGTRARVEGQRPRAGARRPACFSAPRARSARPAGQAS